MGWKRALGFSAFIGNRRMLAEAQEEKEECLIAIRDKHTDWKDMQAHLPKVERDIAKYQAKVDAED